MKLKFRASGSRRIVQDTSSVNLLSRINPLRQTSLPLYCSSDLRLAAKTCTNNPGVSFFPPRQQTRDLRACASCVSIPVTYGFSKSQPHPLSLCSSAGFSILCCLVLDLLPQPNMFRGALNRVQFGALPPIWIPVLIRDQPRPYPSQAPGPYMQNGSGPVPGARPLLPDNGRVIQSGPTRVLCIADVRGKTAHLGIAKDEADKTKATYGR
jgi:hypothetical protein